MSPPIQTKSLLRQDDLPGMLLRALLLTADHWVDDFFGSRTSVGRDRYAGHTNQRVGGIFDDLVPDDPGPVGE